MKDYIIWNKTISHGQWSFETVISSYFTLVSYIALASSKAIRMAKTAKHPQFWIQKLRSGYCYIIPGCLNSIKIQLFLLVDIFLNP